MYNIKVNITKHVYKVITSDYKAITDKETGGEITEEDSQKSTADISLASLFGLLLNLGQSKLSMKSCASIALHTCSCTC